MGCDIHMYVEYRLDGKWVSGDLFEINPYYPKYGPEYRLVELYGYRDYALFGILAGVREPEMPRIADPRGLPRDCNDLIKKEYEHWELDAHSCSWVTLQELIDTQKETTGILDSVGLNNLTDKLKERANELNIIYDFLWTGNKCSRQEAYKKSAGIRIVFWFDN